MTLQEFTNKLFAVGDNTTVYVVEEEPDGYGEEYLRKHIACSSSLLMTHQSCFVLDFYCKDEICKADVTQIYALGKDEYMVVIDTGDD